MEFEQIQNIISEVLSVPADNITMDTTFVDDLGADSLDVYQIIMAIEEEFEVEIPSENAEKIVTAGDAFEQIKNATGYDHNWCLNTYKNGKGDDKTVCASLYSPKSGILLEVFTNEPGIQVYTGNFQGTGISCKHGIKYPKHVSVCFESQKYPDSPTKISQGVKDWTDATLKPGEKYYSHLAYKFSVKK